MTSTHLHTVLRRCWPLPFLFFVGCATAPSTSPMLYTKKVPAKNEVVTGISGNRLESSFQGKRASLFFSPQRVVRGDGNEQFQFVVQVSRENGPFLLIKPGRSLMLEVDGHPWVYTSRQGSGPRRVKAKRFFATTFSESAVYENVTQEDIARISRAQKVRVVISAKSQRIEAEFSEQNFAAFEALLESAALGHASPVPDA